MEWMSPTYLERFRSAHGEWFAKRTTPSDPRAKGLWLKFRELEWDNTARKYTPPSVKGIKPLTLEPWADETMVCAHLRSVNLVHLY